MIFVNAQDDESYDDYSYDSGSNDDGGGFWDSVSDFFESIVEAV